MIRGCVGRFRRRGGRWRPSCTPHGVTRSGACRRGAGRTRALSSGPTMRRIVASCGGTGRPTALWRFALSSWAAACPRRWRRIGPARTGVRIAGYGKRCGMWRVPLRAAARGAAGPGVYRVAPGGPGLVEGPPSAVAGRAAAGCRGGGRHGVYRRQLCRRPRSFIRAGGMGGRLVGRRRSGCPRGSRARGVVGGAPGGRSGRQRCPIPLVRVGGCRRRAGLPCSVGAPLALALGGPAGGGAVWFSRAAGVVRALRPMPGRARASDLRPLFPERVWSALPDGRYDSAIAGAPGWACKATALS